MKIYSASCHVQNIVIKSIPESKVVTNDYKG